MCDCAPFPPCPTNFTIPARRLGCHGIRPTPKSLSFGGPDTPLTRKIGFFPREFRVRSKLTDFDGNSNESLENFIDGRSDEQQIAGNGAPIPSSFDFLELKRELEKKEIGKGGLEEVEGDLDKVQGLERAELGSEEGRGVVERVRVRGGRQVVKRSSLLAKQVISIQSARSLGFVSQLWVDTELWVVVLVEVRPNLLSGDIEKCLLEDVHQVGDVVLLQDESVMDNELKMIGLDTLVGYNVVTPGRRNVGKVRGYTFNINSGAVESLELDSFGFSIVPASLVSTYCLLVEDVLEVASDNVVVHDGAVSRIQRLTKGIWDAQNVDRAGDEMDEYFDLGRGRVRSVRPQRGQNFRGQKFSRKVSDNADDWELPMGYL